MHAYAQCTHGRVDPDSARARARAPLPRAPIPNLHIHAHVCRVYWNKPRIRICMSTCTCTTSILLNTVTAELNKTKKERYTSVNGMHTKKRDDNSGKRYNEKIQENGGRSKKKKKYKGER